MSGHHDVRGVAEFVAWQAELAAQGLEVVYVTEPLLVETSKIGEGDVHVFVSQRGGLRLRRLDRSGEGVHHPRPMSEIAHTPRHDDLDAQRAQAGPSYMGSGTLTQPSNPVLTIADVIGLFDQELELLGSELDRLAHRLSPALLPEQVALAEGRSTDDVYGAPMPLELEARVARLRRLRGSLTDKIDRLALS